MHTTKSGEIMAWGRSGRDVPVLTRQLAEGKLPISNGATLGRRTTGHPPCSGIVDSYTVSERLSLKLKNIVTRREKKGYSNRITGSDYRQGTKVSLKLDNKLLPC